jgi:SAM-dependent methyltransferase
VNYHQVQASLTSRWLAEAGVGPGQRVLDVGCGPGSVTELLLDLVGEAGQVVAIDQSDAYLAAAAARHAGRPVSLRRVDLNEPLPDDLGRFDAIVGRRVLMYLRDPAATLARLAPLAAPGGVVFFQELVLDGARSGLPLHDQTRDWMVRMLAAEGASWAAGRALPAYFRDAGLPPPVMRAEVEVAAPGHPDTITERIGWVLPRLAAAGVDLAEVGVETLADRLRAERDAAAAPWMVELAVAGWCRVGR